MAMQQRLLQAYALNRIGASFPAQYFSGIELGGERDCYKRQASKKEILSKAVDGKAVVSSGGKGRTDFPMSKGSLGATIAYRSSTAQPMDRHTGVDISPSWRSRIDQSSSTASTNSRTK